MEKIEWMGYEWLPQERFSLIVDHEWLVSGNGYLDRNQLFNVDEVGVCMAKKEGKQATSIENRDVRSVQHRAHTGDPYKQFATVYKNRT